MPRLKKQKPETPPVNVQADPNPEVAVPSAPIFPIYENAKVMEIVIPDYNEGFHRCRMSDGTTKDVPKELFSQ